MASSALTGLRNIIPTIMMGNMEIELPAMYMMNRFMGICLNGPRAKSQYFYVKTKNLLQVKPQSCLKGQTECLEVLRATDTFRVNCLGLFWNRNSWCDQNNPSFQA